MVSGTNGLGQGVNGTPQSSGVRPSLLGLRIKKSPLSPPTVISGDVAQAVLTSEQKVDTGQLRDLAYFQEAYGKTFQKKEIETQQAISGNGTPENPNANESDDARIQREARNEINAKRSKLCKQAYDSIKDESEYKALPKDAQECLKADIVNKAKENSDENNPKLEATKLKERAKELGTIYKSLDKDDDYKNLSQANKKIMAEHISTQLDLGIKTGEGNLSDSQLAKGSKSLHTAQKMNDLNKKAENLNQEVKVNGQVVAYQTDPNELKSVIELLNDKDIQGANEDNEKQAKNYAKLCQEHKLDPKNIKPENVQEHMFLLRVAENSHELDDTQKDALKEIKAKTNDKGEIPAQTINYLERKSFPASKELDSLRANNPHHLTKDDETLTFDEHTKLNDEELGVVKKDLGWKEFHKKTVQEKDKLKDELKAEIGDEAYKKLDADGKLDNAVADRLGQKEFDKIKDDKKKINDAYRETLVNNLVGKGKEFSKDDWRKLDKKEQDDILNIYRLHGRVNTGKANEKKTFDAYREKLSPEDKKEFDKLSPEKKRERIKKHLGDDFNPADPASADKINKMPKEKFQEDAKKAKNDIDEEADKLRNGIKEQMQDADQMVNDARNDYLQNMSKAELEQLSKQMQAIKGQTDQICQLVSSMGQMALDTANKGAPSIASAMQQQRQANYQKKMDAFQQAYQMEQQRMTQSAGQKVGQ